MTMKRRIMVALTMAMALAVLSMGVAHAGTRALTTLTNTASSKWVAVGEPVTFTVTETNDESFAISPQVKNELPPGVEFVSVDSSQGQCSFVPGGSGGAGSVQCELGTLPPGATATIDIVVIPTAPGIITNNAYDLINQASASVAVYPFWMPAYLS